MRVVIGRLSRPHGVRGEITVDIRTDEPGSRFAVGSSIICGDRRLVIDSTRPHGSRLIVKFAEITNRADAEALRGLFAEAEVDPADVPHGDEEFYDYQLRGLRVVAAGEPIGELRDIVHGTHQDTLILEISGRDVLAPFVAALVPTIDLQAGEVHIADIDGLLDPELAQEA